MRGCRELGRQLRFLQHILQHNLSHVTYVSICFTCRMMENIDYLADFVSAIHLSLNAPIVDHLMMIST